MMQLSYPESKRGEDFDEAAGIRFADPYRWLERDDDEVRRWQTRQNDLSDIYVQQWPYTLELGRYLEHYLVERIATVPRFVAGQWFRAAQASAGAPPRLVVSTTAYGEGRDIAIRIAEPQAGSTVINWIAPSPDGRLVAVGLCCDGSENNRIELIDVSTGTPLANPPPQLLMDAWMGGVCWLPDAHGFYYLALEGEPQKFRQIVMFHDVRSGAHRPAPVPLPNPHSADYTLITLSRDGSYLVASHGLQAPRPVAVKDLHEPRGQWRSFITSVDGTVSGFVHEGMFIAVSDVGAPRGRVVAIPLDAADPNDSEQWRVLVSESDFVLRSIRPIGEHFYLSGFRETYSEVRVLDVHGRAVDEVPLPSKGAISESLFPLMDQVPSGHPDEYIFVFSSLIESWGVYRHVPGACALDTLRSPQVRIENAVIADHWATSADGTRIPYHTVCLKRAEGRLPAPALLYAYGAFNLALLPEYPGAMAAFIRAGGVYVHGHIRGGAEFGLEWWRAGRMKYKQNCFDDLYAIAEDLRSKGITAPDKLAMTGRSNGGLMAGVAALQRSDLWRAVVSQVPVTDLIGILRDAYGRYALSGEYADPTQPEEIRRLVTFSPYHLVRPGLRHPAFFIEAGATDPRCPPWHARKLAASMQAMTDGGAPVLLRVRENAGHGLATPKDIQLCSYTQWLAFVMRELSMRLDVLTD